MLHTQPLHTCYTCMQSGNETFWGRSRKGGHREEERWRNTQKESEGEGESERGAVSLTQRWRNTQKERVRVRVRVRVRERE